MRRAAVIIAAALVTLSLSSATAAPQEKRARGKITAVSADSVTLDVTGTPMTFKVDSSTEVIARGAGTKAREAEKATGQKPKFIDLVKVGDNVEISYTESGGEMLAKTVRGVSTPATPAGEAAKHLDGVVTEVSGTSLTVKPATGEAMKFMIDAKVRITGEGLTTLTKAKQAQGGKVTLTDAVAVGDTVQVTYTAMGDMNHATAVRITKKKA